MSYSKKTDWIGEMITTKGLLYIEPADPPSEEPLMDDLTLKMGEALQRPVSTGVLAGKSGNFHEGLKSRGKHWCRCGVPSTNVDYKLSNGVVTNALATHYLAWHRDEIPPEQLALVESLPQEMWPVSIKDTMPPKR